MDKVEKILTKNGINVKIGKGKGQLNDGQVFGCEFYPATELKKKLDLQHSEVGLLLEIIQ